MRRTTFDVNRIGATRDQRLRLSGGMSSHVQRGVWSVPPFLALSAGLGSVKLDLQQSGCAHEVVDIAVSGGIGTIVLVPEDEAPAREPGGGLDRRVPPQLVRPTAAEAGAEPDPGRPATAGRHPAGRAAGALTSPTS